MNRMKMALGQNYPNPFNPATTIQYSVRERQWVTLTIFNHLGQYVNTLVQSYRNAGTYRTKWDGKKQNGMPAANGVYFCRLQSEKSTLIRKMTLLR